MLIKIGNFEFTSVWDGVFYKKLSQYPKISDWEIRTIIEFIEYEKKYSRECKIECEDSNLLKLIEDAIFHKEKYLNIQRPKLITECTACPYRKGCVTDFVCHTTSVDNAKKIFQCGKLLSALNARKVPVEELMKEGRNAANDPADYFEYIMLSWGNCQAGDRLVMERNLKRFPTEEDLSINFNPGVRFYFEYENLIKHPDMIFDGVLPMKIKDEIILKDWVYKIVIPTKIKKDLEAFIPSNLKDKVIYIENDCKDIWDWSEKVYKIIENCMIKKIDEQNISECVNVIRESFSTVANEFGFTPTNAPGFTAFSMTEEKLKNQLLEEHRLMFAFYEQENILGFYSLALQDNNECELNNLCVLPSARHKNIGKKLLEHAFQSAKELNCTKMNIGIVEENKILRNWYESFGFIHKGTEKFDFFPFTCGYMEKLF